MPATDVAPDPLPPAHRRLLEAVRVGLGGDPEAATEPIDVAVARLAVHHRVHPQVAAAAGRIGGDPAAVTMLRLKQSMDRAVVTAQIAEMGEVSPALDAAAIPHAFFKGPVLAAQTGRAAEERVGGDLDLLVRPEHWLAAHPILTGRGYTVQRGPEPGDDTRTRFLLWSWWESHYRNAAAELDLHWRPEPGTHPGLHTPDVLARSTIVIAGGVRVATFDPDTALAHSALRAARIGWSELRSIVDCHLLVTVAGADWERAASLVPGHPALAEARRATAAITAPTPPDPGADWVAGFVAGTRPARGLRGDLRQIGALGPSLRSKLAIALHWAIPPESMVGWPAPLWFLGILSAPLRLIRRRSGQAR